MKKFSLAALFVLCASVASADPVYRLGGSCPTNADLAADSSLTRQYIVSPSLACVFDTDVSNIQGSDEEAEEYLDIFGLGEWTGLGETEPGFTYTTDAENDSGEFFISALLNSMYDQFALGIKDGGNPQWAIFLLPADTLSGTWAFGGDEKGDLSHFTLYGFTGTPIINPNCPDCPPGDDPPVIPEPSTLLLFGTGMTYLANRYRKRNQ